jgi:hypothetical protein
VGRRGRIRAGVVSHNGDEHSDSQLDPRCRCRFHVDCSDL